MGLNLFSPVCFLWPSDTYNRFHKKKHNTLKGNILARRVHERPSLCGGRQDHYHTAPASLLQGLPGPPVIFHTCLHDRFYVGMWLCAWSSFYRDPELRLLVLVTDYLSVLLYSVLCLWARSMGVTWAPVRNADSHCSKIPRWCTFRLEGHCSRDFSHHHPWGVSPTPSYW